MSSFTFSNSPTIRYRRSKFDLSHNVKTTCNVGQLIPFDVQEVIPGDTFKCRATALSRVTSSFIKPVMDNLYLEVRHFFVPYRLLYDDFEKVFGVAKPSSYVQDNLKELPSTTSESNVVSGSLADYFKLPIGQVPKGLSLMKPRAYALIYDRWYRNQNVIDETYINTGEANSAESSFNGEPFSPSNYMGMPANVGRMKDIFSACLPSPQKGEPVTVPVSTGVAPVIQMPGTGGAPIGETVYQSSHIENMDGEKVYSSDFGEGDTKPVYTNETFNIKSGFSTVLSPSGAPYAFFDTGVGSTMHILPQDVAYLGNLGVDLSQLPGTAINDWRLAFQLQKMLEKDARYGSRYNEYVAGHYGVSNGDSRLQLPEYLGGSRIPLNVTQVAQTSQSTADSPLANVSGYSLTVGGSRFTKAFTEHGLIMSLCVIRQTHSYQQGIEKDWSRLKRADFYDPLFANIGEQPIYQSELFGVGKSDLKDNVFGYNEAWAEYRYRPNAITGQMRSGLENSLDIWHFADYYDNAPTLSQDFIDETPEFVDRTLSVPSTSQHQFILDFWLQETAIRVMPTYSIPGLIDHH